MLAIIAMFILAIVITFLTYVSIVGGVFSLFSSLLSVFFFLINYSMVKNAFQSFLFFFCVIPTSCI